MIFTRRLLVQLALLFVAGGCTAIPERMALDPPVSPIVYEPVAAWWYYFPDMSDSEWDYFTQVRRGPDPILVQFRPSDHPEHYRVRQTNESAVHAYNQRRLTQQGMRPPAEGGQGGGVRTPRVQASAIAVPSGGRSSRSAGLPASVKVRTLTNIGGDVGEPPVLAQTAGRIATPRFSIRMGMFGSENEAEDVMHRLWALGFNSYQKRDAQSGVAPVIVVNAGPYGDRKEAEEAMTRLRAEIRRVEGGDTFPVEVVPFNP